jgi:hypothetical protein
MPVALAVVVGFALLLGYLAWRTFFGYVAPDYRPLLAWEARWIGHQESELSHTYVRQRISIKGRPVHAWLAVMAPDEFTLFVNGQPVETVEYPSGYAQKVFDVTRLLVAGGNVIAIRNQVGTFPQRPRVVVQGGYTDAAGETFSIRSDGTWRATWRHDSRLTQAGAVASTEWWATQYDDAQWPHAVEAGQPRARITQALADHPAVVTTPLRADWIWADPMRPEAYLRLALDVRDRPRDAWLRIAARRSFRLLVNGHLLVEQETAIGSSARGADALRFYHIAPFLVAGRNVVAIHAANERTDRGLVVDGFLEGSEGLTWFSGAGWRASSTPVPRWETVGFDDAAWQPATVLRPVTPVEQSSLVRTRGTVVPPLPFRLRTLGTAALVILASLVGSLLLWALSARAIGTLAGIATATVRGGLGIVFLFPLVALAGLWALGFDPRFSASFPYQPRFVAASAGFVLVVNGLLVVSAILRRAGQDGGAAPRPARRRPRLPAWCGRFGAELLAVGLAFVGFVLRFKDMTTEPLHGDEAAGLQWAQGVLARGFGSAVIDGRVKPVATSELTYYPKALGVWLAGPNAFGMRIADVIVGCLTILLIYWAGRALLDRRVGLLAAAVYTIVPSAIGMTHHGRYPSQLQFLALLSLVLLFRAFDAGFRPRRYYLAVASLIATYLSWEGSAFFVAAVAIGLVVLTRPGFDWLRNGHVWAGAALLAAVVVFQLSMRFAIQAEWPTYGSGLADTSPALMWRHPFYEPTYYLERFFLLENHHFLTLAFALSAPLWIRRSREGRVLGGMAVTLLAVLVFMTNLLQSANWRYVHYLFPLLVLTACGGLVAFVDRLGALVASATGPRLAAAARCGTAVILVVGLLLFSTSLVVKLYDLPWSYGAQYTRLGARYNPTFGGAAEFLRGRLQPGDVVVSTNAHLLKADLGRVDYYFESSLHQTLLAGSALEVPIHKFTGVPAILSEQELKEGLAGAARVWYVTYNSTFDPALTTLLRRQARVMYEDWRAVVFLLGPPQ